MYEDDYICMNIFDYEIINGEIIPNEPRVVKIPINDILVSNGFELIKNNNVQNNRHKLKILSKNIDVMN